MYMMLHNTKTRSIDWYSPAASEEQPILLNYILKVITNIIFYNFLNIIYNHEYNFLHDCMVCAGAKICIKFD